MHVELNCEMVEDIVERWLKDTVALGKIELERDDLHEEDREFWGGCVEHAEWLLVNNWFQSCPE